MKKKLLLIPLALLLAISLIAIGCPSTPASTEVIELNFSTMFPGTHLYGMINQKFCDVIKERTNGRVEITLFPGGSLTSAPKCYEGVVQGLSDIGMSCPLYVAGRFPASSLFELPQDVPNAWVSSHVYDDFYRHFQLEEFDDVHILYLHAPGYAVLQSNKRVSKPEDLNGVIVRSSGTSAEVIQAWGGTPQAMPMGEAYESLSKGVVDANFAYCETLAGWKHGDVVKYVTKFPVGCSSCQFVAMNKDKWDSLPEDIKEIFTETSEEFLEYQARAWVYMDKIGLEYFLSLGEGREYIEIPQGERSVWLALVQPLLDKYVEEKTAMGLPAEEYFAYVAERSKYYAGIQPTGEECVETVETELLK